MQYLTFILKLNCTILALQDRCYIKWKFSSTSDILLFPDWVAEKNARIKFYKRNESFSENFVVIAGRLFLTITNTLLSFDWYSYTPWTSRNLKLLLIFHRRLRRNIQIPLSMSRITFIQKSTSKKFRESKERRTFKRIEKSRKWEQKNKCPWHDDDMTVTLS